MVENTKQGIGKKIEMEKKSAKIVKKNLKMKKKVKSLLLIPEKKLKPAKKIIVDKNFPSQLRKFS